MTPSRDQLLARVREFQDQTKTTLTDDEVKGVLCSVWSNKSIHAIERWESLAVQYCVRALEERLRSTPARKGGDDG